MKDVQKYRFGVQILSLVLTITSFFVSFKATMLIILGLTLLSGVFYCGWVCPFGFIQDLLSKLGRLLGIKKRKMPRPIQRLLVFSRYILFGFVILVGADLIFNIMSFDPRVNFENILLGNMITIGAIAVVSFFSLVALFFERPFCNYFCYEGAKYGLMSFFRPFTIKRNPSTCVSCKKCDKACPMNIKVSDCNSLRSPQCINCFQCTSSCPVDGALSFGKMNMKKDEKKRYFSMLAVVFVLITAFIVYNIFNGTSPLNIKDKHHGETIPSKTTMTEDLPSTPNETTVIIGENAEAFGDAKGISDGVYTGVGIGFRGAMTVQVTVQNQQIVTVEVINHKDDRKWFNRANNIIPGRIVETQSIDIDVVSGATYSSMGIRDGVKDALEKAK